MNNKTIFKYGIEKGKIDDNSKYIGLPYKQTYNTPVFGIGSAGLEGGSVNVLENSEIGASFTVPVVNQVITNGNFTVSTGNLATGFSLGSATAISCTGNIQTFIATVHYGALFTSTPLTAGHRYFLIANIKASTANACIRCDNGNSVYSTSSYHTGDGNYHILNVILDMVNTKSSQGAGIMDFGTSAWANISVQNFEAIDMGTAASPNANYNYTQAQMLNEINNGSTYWEGNASIVNPQLRGCGKNYLNENGFMSGCVGSAVVTKNSNGTYKYKQTTTVGSMSGTLNFAVNQNTSYSVKISNLNNITDTAMFVLKVCSGNTTLTTYYTGTGSLPFTTPLGTDNIKLYATSAGQTTIAEYDFNIQLEQSSTATTYEAYKEAKLNVTGTFATNDTFTYQNGIAYKNSVQVTSTGSLMAFKNGMMFFENSLIIPNILVEYIKETNNRSLVKSSSPIFATGTGDSQLTPIGFRDSGLVGFEFTVPVVNQVITNGNMVSTTGWILSSSTLSAASNILSVIGTGTGTGPSAYKSTTLSYLSGNRLFINLWVMATNSNCTSLATYMESSGYAGDLIIASKFTPIINTWYQLTGIVNLPSGWAAGNTMINVRHNYASAGASNGMIIQVKQVEIVDMGIDITNPLFNFTQAQMLNLINNGSTYWEGNESIVNPQLRGYGRNLIKQSSCNNELPNLAFNGLEGISRLTTTFDADMLVLTATSDASSDKYYEIGHVNSTETQGFTNLTDYTFSFDCFIPTGTTLPYIYFFYYNGTSYASIQKQLIGVVYDVVKRYTVVAQYPSNAVGKFIRIQFPTVVMGQFIKIRNIQLEQNTVATTYEAYKESIISLTTSLVVGDRVECVNNAAHKISGGVITDIPTSGSLQSFANGSIFVSSNTIIPTIDYIYDLGYIIDGTSTTNLSRVDDGGSIDIINRLMWHSEDSSSGTTYIYEKEVMKSLLLSDIGTYGEEIRYKVDGFYIGIPQVIKENYGVNVLENIIYNEVGRGLQSIEDLKRCYDAELISEENLLGLTSLFKIPFPYNTNVDAIREFLKYYMKIRKIRGGVVSIAAMTKLCGVCDNWGNLERVDLNDVEVINAGEGYIKVRCGYIKNTDFLMIMLKKVTPATFKISFVNSYITDAGTEEDDMGIRELGRFVEASNIEKS